MRRSPYGIGLATGAAERHERWELDHTLVATLAVGGGGDLSPWVSECPPSRGAKASVGC